MLQFVNVNLAAVAVAAIVSVVLGFIWYSPSVFGKKWMKLVGLKKMGDNMAVGAIGMLVLSLIVAHVLGAFTVYLNATNWTDGALVGLMAWIGFVGAINLNNVLFRKEPWNLFFIEAGYQLVSLLVMGAILGMMR